jgi:hypothetical protein
MASIFAKISQASSLINTVKGLVTVPKKTVIHNLVIDCVHSEDTEYSNTITNDPVDSKKAVSDHVFSNATVISINGTITNTNFKMFGIIEQPLQANSIQKIVSNAKQLISLNSQKPSELARKALTTLVNEKTLVSVATKYEVYHNMMIENLKFNDNESTVHRLLFTCNLKQVTFVRVAYASYTPRNPLKSVGKVVDKSVQQVIETKEVESVSGIKTLFRGGAKWIGKNTGSIIDAITDGTQ